MGEQSFNLLWENSHTFSVDEVLAARWKQSTPFRVAQQQTKKPPSYPAGLSKREIEVLRLVAAGLTDTQVADQLVISPRTATTHMTSIYNKLGINSRAAATRFAVEHALLCENPQVHSRIRNRDT